MTCAEDLPEFEHIAENVDNQITDGYDEEVSLSFQKSFVYSCEVSVEERLAQQVICSTNSWPVQKHVGTKGRRGPERCEEYDYVPSPSGEDPLSH